MLHGRTRSRNLRFCSKCPVLIIIILIFWAEYFESYHINIMRPGKAPNSPLSIFQRLNPPLLPSSSDKKGGSGNNIDRRTFYARMSFSF